MCPCSAKIRASDRDLPVKDIKIQSMRYYPTQSDPILDPEGPIQPNFWYTRFKLAQNIFGLVNRRKRLWILVPFKRRWKENIICGKVAFQEINPHSIDQLQKFSLPSRAFKIVDR